MLGSKTRICHLCFAVAGECGLTYFCRIIMSTFSSVCSLLSFMFLNVCSASFWRCE